VAAANIGEMAKARSAAAGESGSRRKRMTSGKLLWRISAYGGGKASSMLKCDVAAAALTVIS